MADDKTQGGLVDILQRAMDAAGIHDADPETLPERIQELRFIGTAYVANGMYPRCNKLAKEKQVKGRKKGQAYLGAVT